MSTANYRHSITTRLKVLFSPVRLTLFIAAVVWLVVLNVIYMSNYGQPEWAGPASVFPIIMWVTWMLITDSQHRVRAKQASSPRR